MISLLSFILLRLRVESVRRQSYFTRSQQVVGKHLELAPFILEVVACALVDNKFRALVFLGNLRV
jgi:hypothetical protein